MHPLGRLLPLVLCCLFASSVSAQPANASNIETLFRPGSANSERTIDHSVWDKLLKAYITPAEKGLNRIDYSRFRSKDLQTLKEYLVRLQATDVTRLGRAEQFAFWANLYNAKSIEVVLENYPVRSIRDINLGGGLFAALTGGPWKAKILKVNGKELSLDDVEHVILRGLFKDHRVHFAVNCASVGCPNVSATAYTGAGLDAHLDRNGRAFVNSPRGVKLVDGKLHVSKIFEWFKADFGGTDAKLIALLRTYASPELKQKLDRVTEISEYFYDWSLNDTSG